MASRPHSTVEQLRSDIDGGRTLDKIRGSDAAMAPLGADEEAAGTPLSAEAISQARDYEKRVATDQDLPPRGTRPAWVLIGLIFVLAVVIVAAGFLIRT